MDPDGKRGDEELEGAEGKETIIKICWMKTKLFKKKKKDMGKTLETQRLQHWNKDCLRRDFWFSQVIVGKKYLKYCGFIFLRV